MFEDSTVGIIWIENDAGIENFISFNKNEITKGTLSIYTASSYDNIDIIAKYLNCKRIVARPSIKDIGVLQHLVDCGFKNTYVALYKKINKKD
jgi:hypothetical protein